MGSLGFLHGIRNNFNHYCTVYFILLHNYVDCHNNTFLTLRGVDTSTGWDYMHSKFYLNGKLVFYSMRMSLQLL